MHMSLNQKLFLPADRVINRIRAPKSFIMNREKNRIAKWERDCRVPFLFQPVWSWSFAFPHNASSQVTGIIPPPKLTPLFLRQPWDPNTFRKMLRSSLVAEQNTIFWELKVYKLYLRLTFLVVPFVCPSTNTEKALSRPFFKVKNILLHRH